MRSLHIAADAERSLNSQLPQDPMFHIWQKTTAEPTFSSSQMREIELGLGSVVGSKSNIGLVVGSKFTGLMSGVIAAGDSIGACSMVGSAIGVLTMGASASKDGKNVGKMLGTDASPFIWIELEIMLSSILGTKLMMSSSALGTRLLMTLEELGALLETGNHDSADNEDSIVGGAVGESFVGETVLLVSLVAIRDSIVGDSIVFALLVGV
jgi:hypothetical protein